MSVAPKPRPPNTVQQIGITDHSGLGRLSFPTRLRSQIGRSRPMELELSTGSDRPPAISLEVVARRRVRITGYFVDVCHQVLDTILTGVTEGVEAVDLQPAGQVQLPEILMVLP
jgi:hypothetical protein